MQLDPVIINALPGPAHSVLDLGCGKGELLAELQSRGYRLLLGVDKNVPMNSLDGGNLFLVEKDAIEYLRTNNMPYACVILYDVLEHIHRKDVMTLLRLIKDNLRKDGTLILHLPNAEGLFGSRILHSDLTHRWAYTPQLITSLLTKAGFVHIECHEARPIVHGPVSFLRYLLWIAISMLGRFVLSMETGVSGGIMSQNMIVVAKKSVAACRGTPGSS